MRFSYTLVALAGLATALPTDTSAERRSAVDTASAPEVARDVASFGLSAEIEARAEGLQLLESRKKKNKTAKAAAKAAAAAAAAAAPATARDISDFGNSAEIEARAEGLQLLESRKKKNKTAKAAAKAAAAAAAAAAPATARDISDFGNSADIEARAEGLQLLESRKKKNKTAKAAAKAAKAATAAAAAAPATARGIEDFGNSADVEARAEGLQMLESRKKKNKTAKAAAKAAAAAAAAAAAPAARGMANLDFGVDVE